MTATRLSGFSSSAVNGRPSCGWTPRTEKNGDVTYCIDSSSGSPPPVTVTVKVRPTAAISSNVWFISRQ